MSLLPAVAVLVVVVTVICQIVVGIEQLMLQFEIVELASGGLAEKRI